MKSESIKYSKIAILLCLLLSIVIRFNYFKNNDKNGYNATTWDAFGYYMYLPSTFIYKDVKSLDWLPKIDSTYHVTGGHLYQANPLENGNYAFKYLGGVSIMQIPFFAIGHGLANLTGEPTDGFSWPYQYAIMWGAIFWFLIGLLFMRKVLLKYYSEFTTALTLLFLVFTSNLIHYISIDGAMSHSFIFPLYALLLWFTIRWHESFEWKHAFGIGLVIGLATISRPTELIMIFIPILWSLEKNGSLKSKWAMVGKHRTQLALCFFGGLLGIAPQLIYWKYATGSWIYDVGSKWFFLNPWWRVLFGTEKGWFLYTPVAILMIIGLFYLKGKPFRKAVLTFVLLNIWIVISWSDWKYGASYSTRALTQSYPVIALALAAFFEKHWVGKRKLIFGILGILLTLLNFYQLSIYNSGKLESFSPLIFGFQ